MEQNIDKIAAYNDNEKTTLLYLWLYLFFCLRTEPSFFLIMT